MAIDLNSKEVYKVLVEKGLKYFYHANTVQTSFTFIDKNALLSRHYVEENGLKQTSQSSDQKDKELGIWDYIFLDAKDLGEYFSKPNVYGPVLFALDNKLLLDSSIPTIRITKNNPYYWSDKDNEDKHYYTDIEAFEKSYLTGDKDLDGKTMFIITTLSGKFDLTKYLVGIKVDNCGIEVTNKDGTEVNLSLSILNKVKEKLIPTYKDKLTFKIRNEWFFKNIYQWNYERNKNKFKRLFYP